jgi:hypothetical protein
LGGSFWCIKFESGVLWHSGGGGGKRGPGLVHLYLSIYFSFISTVK